MAYYISITNFGSNVVNRSTYWPLRTKHCKTALLIVRIVPLRRTAVAFSDTFFDRRHLKAFWEPQQQVNRWKQMAENDETVFSGLVSNEPIAMWDGKGCYGVGSSGVFGARTPTTPFLQETFLVSAFPLQRPWKMPRISAARSVSSILEGGEIVFTHYLSLTVQFNELPLVSAGSNTFPRNVP